MGSRRLDRASIVKHWREHGPRGAYVATTCDKVLDDGSRATLLFVVPACAFTMTATILTMSAAMDQKKLQ